MTGTTQTIVGTNVDAGKYTAAKIYFITDRFSYKQVEGGWDATSPVYYMKNPIITLDQPLDIPTDNTLNIVLAIDVDDAITRDEVARRWYLDLQSAQASTELIEGMHLS